MPGCSYSCLEQKAHVGSQSCCHTCAYYIGGACRASSGWGYYPRALLRILREA